MNPGLRFVLISILSFLCVGVVAAQGQTSAAQSVESLRSQLSDVQRREEELQTRSRQLDEDLRPENIEKYFALNGSTHPEELREQRRRQLEAEKSKVSSQLSQLATSRASLEASIATAEAAAYRQSAGANSSSLRPQVDTGSEQTVTTAPADKATPAKGKRAARSRQRRRVRH